MYLSLQQNERRKKSYDHLNIHRKKMKKWEKTLFYAKNSQQTRSRRVHTRSL